MNKMYYNDNAVGIVNHTSVDNQALIGLIQRSATSIDIPSGTTSIGEYAFSDYNSLASVTIPDSVTSIGASAFNGCRSLPSIDIPNSVTTIGWVAFAGCSSLTSIDIPDSVTSIGTSAFMSCDGLTSCIIGSGVTSIGQYAFYSCSGLTSITVNATTPPTLGNNAFQGTPIASGTGYIYVPSADVYKQANGWKTFATQIMEIPT